jgi:hypothetical protein
MANEVLLKVGTQIRFSGSGFSPADSGTDFSIGTPTDVSLTLSGVVNGAGRQSAKADLTATRARLYEVLAAVDFTGETPTSGQTVNFYWAPSTSATTGNGNVAGNSGNDAAAPDGALGSITLAQFLLQCQTIGSLVIHDGASVQNGLVSVFSPSGRYGQMIVVNNSGDPFEADNVEAHVVMNPIVDEIQ